MSKSGIKIMSETLGTGAVVAKSDRVRVLYDIRLSGGDVLVQDEWRTLALNDREVIAGFRYGLEGMRVGGTRTFKASPHLCYADKELDRIPKNAVLVVTVKNVKIVK